MRIFFALFISICCLIFDFEKLEANPFAINFSPKENLTTEDYINIQYQIQGINISPVLKQLYPKNQGYSPYHDFFARCTRCLRQCLIEPERGLFPTQQLEKIGKGSDMCVVCCAPYDGVRDNLIQSITSGLQSTGFNGYFLSLTGGFPNPTGREILYVGVPYSFKVFMMLEAYKLGFNKVLWIDSAA